MLGRGGGGGSKRENEKRGLEWVPVSSREVPQKNVGGGGG